MNLSRRALALADSDSDAEIHNLIYLLSYEGWGRDCFFLLF